MNRTAQQTDPTPVRPPRPLWIAAATLALAALAVSGYLTAQSLSGAPAAGCGGGTGCGAVLASPWAKAGPVPVSALGVLVYAVVLAALGCRYFLPNRVRLADAALFACAAAIPAAAGWFVYVQLVELGEFCVYCMAGHTLGVVLAALICVMLIGRSTARPVLPIALGLSGVAALAAFQTFVPASGATQGTTNPFVDRDGDSVIDGGRHVSMFGGNLRFTLEDQPHLGEPDADQVLAMLFDPACPHCRATHRLITDTLDADGGFAFVPLPISLAPDHNPHLDDPSPRFADSHALAALSHAVAAADRIQWRAFARWLMADDEPPTYDEARAHAASLVGTDALDRQLTAAALAQHHAEIDRHTALLALIPEADRRVPVTTAPGASRHRTERLYTSAEIQALLTEAAAGLRVADTP